MRIIEITDKHRWDKFVTGVTPNSFFQSWNWGELQRAIGHAIYRLGVFDAEKLLGVTLVMHMRGKKGSFFHLRHGPVLQDWSREDLLDALLDSIKSLAVKDRVDFIRVSPLIEHTDAHVSLFRRRGFRESSLHIMDAVYDWVLDLTTSELEILSDMRKTTRNLIRRAERDGVKVRSSREVSDLPIFHRLHHETMQRQHYASYPDHQLSREFEIFARDNQALLWFAEYQGQPIATAMMIYYGHQAFYHWAGRSSAHAKIPGAYLLQWESIKAAKARGCTVYNFWGIAPDDNPKHPWAGLTLFKKGFGGRLVHYLHAQDLALTKRYWVTFAAEKFRRWQRGL